MTFAQGASESSAPCFLFPTTGVKTERNAVLLAIDDASLPLKRNLCCYLSKPKVRREPVLTPSRENPLAPGYLAAHFYGTVLFDQGKFRMWYYPCHLGRNPDWLTTEQSPVTPVPGKQSLAELGGRTVRLRIHLRKVGPAEPKLFAVYLEASRPAAKRASPGCARHSWPTLDRWRENHAPAALDRTHPTKEEPLRPTGRWSCSLLSVCWVTSIRRCPGMCPWRSIGVEHREGIIADRRDRRQPLFD
jgi:hypothetical protein